MGRHVTIITPRWIYIDQAAKEQKANIQEITEEMKKGISDIQVYVERSKALSRKSREKIAAARNKAMTCLEELIRVVKEHETTMLTSLDVIDETGKRGHATQLEHFQSSINQLQASVEYCQGHPTVRFGKYLFGRPKIA